MPATASFHFGQRCESTSAKALDNVDNKIVGYGTIGDGNSAHLTLDNETDGVIGANASGEALIIDTGNAVTNAGLIGATDGGELQLKDSVTNSDGKIAAFGTGSVVQILGVTVTDGVLKTDTKGTIDIESGASSSTSTLDDVTATNHGTIEIGIAADGTAAPPSSTTLTLNGGSSITDGDLSFGLTGNTVNVEGSATLADVAVTGGGTVEVGVSGNSSSTTLTLNGGSSITDGDLSFGLAGNTVNVEGSATLADVAVTGGGTVEVGVSGNSSSTTLTLNGGSSITDGDLSFGLTGNTVNVEGSATLADVAVTGGGTVEVGVSGNSSSTTLTLNGGSSITDGDLSFGLAGNTVNVEGSATLADVAVTGGGTVEVGVSGNSSSTTLTLNGGSSITDGDLSFGLAGNTVDVEGSATLADVAVTGGGTVEVGVSGNSSSTTLTLNGGSSITDGDLSFGLAGNTVNVEGSATLADVAVTGGGTVEVGVSGDSSSTTLTLNGGSSITDGDLSFGLAGNTVDVEGSATLADVAVTGGGTVEVGVSGELVVDDADAQRRQLDHRRRSELRPRRQHRRRRGQRHARRCGGDRRRHGRGRRFRRLVVDDADAQRRQLDHRRRSELRPRRQHRRRRGQRHARRCGGDRRRHGRGRRFRQLVVDDADAQRRQLDHRRRSSFGLAGNTVDVEGSATLADVAVTGGGTVEVGVSGDSSSTTLTLNGGSSITDGDLSFGLAGNTVNVEGSATLADVAVTGGGTVEVGVSGNSSSTTLTLNGGSSITDGDLSLGLAGNTVNVEGSATLADVAVTGGGTVEVGVSGNSSSTTLTLNGGSSITDGDLSFGLAGNTVDVEGSATLADVAVTGGGTVEVGVSGNSSSTTLTLNGGSSITDGDLSSASPATPSTSRAAPRSPMWR